MQKKVNKKAKLNKGETNMEYQLYQSVQKLMSDYEKTEHKSLMEIFDSEKITVKDHIKSILSSQASACRILNEKFKIPYNYASDAHRQLGDFLLKCENDIKLAIILHDIGEIELDFDEDDQENDQSENVEDSDQLEQEEENKDETIKYYKYLSHYFGKKFKDIIGEEIIKIIANHHIDLNDTEKLETLFSEESDEWIVMFLYFMISHDYGTLSLLPEFKLKEPCRETKEIYADWTDVVEISISMRYNPVFEILNKMYQKTTADQGKEFTSKVIALSNAANREGMPATDETVASGDVGGGSSPHSLGDARHSNLFGQSFQRAWQVYKKRKNLGLNLKNTKIKKQQ